jgi:hypothetical protein
MPNQKVLVVGTDLPIDEKEIMLGQVVQIVSNTVASVSGTTQVPFDNTTPLITEGFQILSLDITPKASDSRIYIFFNLNIDHSANNRTVTATVWAGTSLIYTHSVNLATAGRPISLPIHTWFDSTDTTLKNIQVRVGANGNGTTYVGASPTANLGGNRFSDYSVMEVLNV